MFFTEKQKPHHITHLKTDLFKPVLCNSPRNYYGVFLPFIAFLRDGKKHSPATLFVISDIFRYTCL